MDQPVHTAAAAPVSQQQRMLAPGNKKQDVGASTANQIIAEGEDPPETWKPGKQELVITGAMAILAIMVSVGTLYCGPSCATSPNTIACNDCMTDGSFIFWLDATILVPALPVTLLPIYNLSVFQRPRLVDMGSGWLQRAQITQSQPCICVLSAFFFANLRFLSKTPARGLNGTALESFRNNAVFLLYIGATSEIYN